MPWRNWEPPRFQTLKEPSEDLSPLRTPTGAKLKVAVLAATGMVGQRYVSMLSNHSYFRLVTVTGQSNVGKRY